MSDRFTIVYTKLAEIVAGGDHEATATISHQELDEIAELRRIVLETGEPDQVCYSGT
jgi:hypothetical protein